MEQYLDKLYLYVRQTQKLSIVWHVIVRVQDVYCILDETPLEAGGLVGQL